MVSLFKNPMEKVFEEHVVSVDCVTSDINADTHIVAGVIDIILGKIESLNSLGLPTPTADHMSACVPLEENEEAWIKLIERI